MLSVVLNAFKQETGRVANIAHVCGNQPFEKVT